MSIVVGVRVEDDVSENLHADDCIDEEQHPDQQDDIREGLQCNDGGV